MWGRKMKKVLFTATVDSHILHFHIPYLQYFHEQGYEVHVATNGTEEIPFCDVKHTVSFERSPFKANNIKAIKQLKEIIDKEKFNIIHCHTPMGSVVTRLAAKQARKKYNTKVMYTAHGFHFFKGAPILNWILFYPVEKWLSKYTDCLITINEEDYTLAKNKFHAKKVELVHGVGVDEKKFQLNMSEEEKHNLRKQLGLQDDDFVLIYVAELNKNKNQMMLIQAMQQITDKTIKLLLVGKGELQEYYKQQVKQMHLDKNIIFTGYRKDIPQLLKISDLCVATSKREGLPVNIIEAMMSGLPIIATNCRGHRDLIKNEKNGYILEINDIQGLQECILKLYNEENLRKNMGKTGEKSAQQYLLKNIQDKMKKIYNEVEI